jgi:fatty-acyl-CoA synthase
MDRYALNTLADIEALEAQPYAHFMPHGSVFAALEEAAAEHAHRTALTFIEDGDLATPASHWRYDEFIAQVRRAANLFHRLGGGAPRVALLLPAIPQAYFALFGAETAGIVCPINYLLDDRHIADLLNTAQANILVALGPRGDFAIAEKVAALRPACPGLRHVLFVGGTADDSFDAALARQPGDRLHFERSVDGDTTAALFHTGGTTGKPKLARHLHRNQLHSAWASARLYALDEHDRVLNGLPIFHVAGSLLYGLGMLMSGGTVVLPTRLGLRNPAFMRQYWAFAARERLTVLTATPTGIATILTQPTDGHDLSALRLLVTGGAPLPPELARAFEARLQVPVRNTLGMSECAGALAIEPALAPREVISCGLRLPFVEVRFDDGVLCLRGPNVSPGYTDASRNPGTFEADGWLVSGDIGHLDAHGRVHVTGRAKDVIIRNSHNIDPLLIEDALMAHPGVSMAAAVGAPDAYAGEVPAAYVVATPGTALDLEALREHLRHTIHEPPAMPRRLELIDALPLTPVGKVFKPTLRAQAAQAVLREQLDGHEWGRTVDVRGDVTDQGIELVFSLPQDDVVLHERIRLLMRPYAQAFRVETGRRTVH